MEKSLKESMSLARMAQEQQLAIRHFEDENRQCAPVFVAVGEPHPDPILRRAQALRFAPERVLPNYQGLYLDDDEAITDMVMGDARFDPENAHNTYCIEAVLGDMDYGGKIFAVRDIYRKETQHQFLKDFGFVRGPHLPHMLAATREPMSGSEVRQVNRDDIMRWIPLGIEETPQDTGKPELTGMIHHVVLEMDEPARRAAILAGEAYDRLEHFFTHMSKHFNPAYGGDLFEKNVNEVERRLRRCAATLGYYVSTSKAHEDHTLNVAGGLADIMNERDEGRRRKRFDWWFKQAFHASHHVERYLSGLTSREGPFTRQDQSLPEAHAKVPVVKYSKVPDIVGDIRIVEPPYVDEAYEPQVHAILSGKHGHVFVNMHELESKLLERLPEIGPLESNLLNEAAMRIRQRPSLELPAYVNTMKPSTLHARMENDIANALAPKRKEESRAVTSSPYARLKRAVGSYTHALSGLLG